MQIESDATIKESDLYKQIVSYLPSNYDTFYQKTVHFIIKLINQRYKLGKYNASDIESLYYDAFFKISEPLQKIPLCLPKLIGKLIESMCKMFLLSIKLICTSERFPQMWHTLLKSVLAFVEKGKKAKEPDVVNLGLESVKNIVMVMKVEQVKSPPNTIDFWPATYKMLEDHLPNLN
jgi:hypothetical protein